VGSYQEFAAAATVHAADFDEADVQAWGDVAVATCRFALDYEMGGERSQDAGWDVLVLCRAAAGWQVVWRTVIPADGAGPPSS
jgi:ketosteroid isomerase-like protein